MRRSTDRIITSHVGSLPRPLDLFEMLRKRSDGAPFDEATFNARVRDAVTTVVNEQAQAGIDVVSDGEQSKPMFADYIAERVSGFEGSYTGPDPFVNYTRHPEPFPAYAALRDSERANPDRGAMSRRPVCVDHWRGRTAPTKPISRTSKRRSLTPL